MFDFRCLFAVVIYCYSNNLSVVESIRESRQYSSTNDSAIIKEVQDRVLNSNTSSSSNKECGKIYSQPQFIIESPNYPSNYPPNLECSYILKGSDCETTFQFQFLDFFLEKSLGCANDRLEVQNLDAICGSMQGAKNYIANNGILELKFITNADNSGRGFRILVSRNICVPTVAPPTINRPKTEGDNEPRNANIPVPPVVTYAPHRPCDHPLTPPQIDPGYNYDPPGGFTPSTIYPYLPPIAPIYPTAPVYPNLPPTVPTSNTNYLCCASSYNEKRFYLASPGFPYSNNHPTDCVYNIFRASAKICRLRINFHFFWIGDNEYSNQQCNNGFLEVDGKHICGCHTGMKLISPFDGRFSDRKMIRFRNVGLPRSIFSGFAIEVTQDECPKRYSPNANTTTQSSFMFYNDQNNRVAWPNITRKEDTIKRAVLVSENTEIIDTKNLKVATNRDDLAANGSDRLIKSVYFFDYDDYYDNTPKFNKPRDVEENAYVDTQDIATSFTGWGVDDGHKCRMWGVLQWTLLTKDILWQRMQKCNTVTTVRPGTTPNIATQEPCKDFNFSKGFFQTPGYPFSYPVNMNLCYRFVKQQGFCKLKLYFVDFHLEDSVECTKDYLSYENYRYCGGKLLNSISYFDISNKRHEQIRFITDSMYSGRGFKGIYEQIPCVVQTRPPSKWPPTYLPPPPPTPIYPITTPTAPVNHCHRDIQDSDFNIGVYDYGTKHCTFVVHKSTPDVCQLQLVFITFELICGQEYFLINNMQYCGRLSGQTLLLDYRSEEIVLTYYGGNAQQKQLKLHIAGKQIRANCGNDNNPDDIDIDLPPAQRILDKGKSGVVAFDKDNLFLVPKNKTESDIHLILKKQYKEICGVLMNIQKVKFKDALCNLLVNNRKNIDCTPLTNNTIYVPYNKLEKLELNFKNVEEVMNVEFMEISCNSQQVLA